MREIKDSTRSSYSLPRLSIITPTCRRDLERCALLNESIDRFERGIFEHVIIVDAHDWNVFRYMSEGRRRVVIRQSFIPDELITGDVPPTGWIMQQLIKLSAPLFTSADIYLFADSDVCFLRSFTLDDFYANGMVDFFCEPARNFDGPESKLMRSGPRLLKIPYEKGNQYIMPLITWRRDILIELRNHVENIWSVPNWLCILADEKDLSEYGLYGEFVDNVIRDRLRHYRNSSKIRCHCRWTKSFESHTELTAFFSAIPNNSLAVLVQSCIGTDVAVYRQLIIDLWSRADAL